MSIETLTVGGVDFTATYGLYVDASRSYDKPQKNVETISIPGRNGDLVIDHDTFKNIVITYPCFINGDYAEQRFSNVINALGAMRGYQEIRCSNDPNHFREGVPVIQQSPTVKRLNSDIYFNISFNCKPQRFVYPQSSETLNSTTLFDGPLLSFRPVFYVKGSGTITIERYDKTTSDILESWTVTVSNAPSIYIDCELQECYQLGGASGNQYVTLSPNSYPVIRAFDGEAVAIRKTGFTSASVNWRRWNL